MIDFQILASLVFVVFLIVFLYFKRDKIKLQKIFFPMIYVFTYHSKVGIKSMDKLAKKFPRTIKSFGYASIGIGILGLFLICFLMIKGFIEFLTVKKFVSDVQFVLPIPVEGIFYVPFFYWIIALMILATIHEFSHGVVARVWNQKIKTTGVGFVAFLVPLLPLAFVEPDEKKLRKSELKKQLSVYSAGPASNIILGFLLLFIAILFIVPFITSWYAQDGIYIAGFERQDDILFPAEEAGMVAGERIVSIDGVPTLEFEEFTGYLSEKSPGDTVMVSTNVTEYSIVLAENPADSSKAYLGVSVYPSQHLKEDIEQNYGFWLPAIVWLIGLFEVLILFNIGIGLINLFPIYITDGAQMLRAIFEKKFKNKMKYYSLINKVCLIILLILVFFPLIKNMFSGLLSLF